MNLLLPFIFLFHAHAAIDLTTVKNIEVNAKNLSVVLAESDAAEIRWKTSNVSWEIKQEGDRLIFNSDADSDTVSDLIFSGNPLSLRMYASKANLKVEKWSADIYGRFMEVNMWSQNTAGKMNVLSQTGELQISKHTGPSKFDLSNATLSLLDITGPIDIEQFAGKNQIARVDGELKVHTQKAATSISDSKGKLTYDSIRGEIQLSNYQGSIRGKSGQGLSVLKPLAKSSLVWRADQGNLRLAIKKINGAYLDIATKEGDLYLVPPLKAKNEGVWRVARAKLRGSESGSVMIRTNKGNVRLKYE